MILPEHYDAVRRVRFVQVNQDCITANVNSQDLQNIQNRHRAYMAAKVRESWVDHGYSELSTRKKFASVLYIFQVVPCISGVVPFCVQRRLRTVLHLTSPVIFVLWTVLHLTSPVMFVLVLWTVLHSKMPVINVLFTIIGLNHNRFNTQFQSRFQWMLIETERIKFV